VQKRGIFVVAELTGPAREAVREVQRWADPKLHRATRPHVTLVGSSGVGPIPSGTPGARLRELVEPIATTTEPLTLEFGRPVRFMQTDIIVLPLDPHGALRALHERIATCGLRFDPARFPFSPHCTLSFFRVLTPDMARRLLRVRVSEPVVIDRLHFYLTVEPNPGRKLLELPLGEETGVQGSGFRRQGTAS
jgi:2'-5' RNA ligase